MKKWIVELSDEVKEDFCKCGYQKGAVAQALENAIPYNESDGDAVSRKSLISTMDDMMMYYREDGDKSKTFDIESVIYGLTLAENLVLRSQAVEVKPK